MTPEEFEVDLITPLLLAHREALQGRAPDSDVAAAVKRLWTQISGQNMYYILETRQGESVTNNQLVWYRPNACGYTMYLSAAGKFNAELAALHNDSLRRAIPCDFVDRLAELTVPNERENFKRCIHAAMPLREVDR